MLEKKKRKRKTDDAINGQLLQQEPLFFFEKPEACLVSHEAKQLRVICFDKKVIIWF